VTFALPEPILLAPGHELALGLHSFDTDLMLVLNPFWAKKAALVGRDVCVKPLAEIVTFEGFLTLLGLTLTETLGPPAATAVPAKASPASTAIERGVLGS
jgi:hypothetical protein